MVRLHKRTVFAVCLANTHSLHDAEDITQEVFLQAFKKLSRLRHQERTCAWLVRIARNACITHYRKKRLTTSPILDATPSPPKSNPPIERLHEALFRLSDDYRETISLYYLDGRNCAAVAITLGITEPAVRQRLVRYLVFRGCLVYYHWAWGIT